METLWFSYISFLLPCETNFSSHLSYTLNLKISDLTRKKLLWTIFFSTKFGSAITTTLRKTSTARIAGYFIEWISLFTLVKPEKLIPAYAYFVKIQVRSYTALFIFLREQLRERRRLPSSLAPPLLLLYAPPQKTNVLSLAHNQQRQAIAGFIISSAFSIFKSFLNSSSLAGMILVKMNRLKITKRWKQQKPDLITYDELDNITTHCIIPPYILQFMKY